jgi:hypothetical protein
MSNYLCVREGPALKPGARFNPTAGEFGKQPLMEGHHGLPQHPLRALHFASSRNVFR